MTRTGWKVEVPNSVVAAAETAVSVGPGQSCDPIADPRPAAAAVPSRLCFAADRIGDFAAAAVSVFWHFDESRCWTGRSRGQQKISSTRLSEGRVGRVGRGF